MIRRLYVEKRPGFDIEARSVLQDLRESLGLKGLHGLRVLARYDVEGLDDEQFARAKRRVFAEPQADVVYDEEFPQGDDEQAFGVEYLPGQFDQRADSAAQCIQILTRQERPRVGSGRVYVLKGSISAEELEEVKEYLINTVDSREAPAAKPESLTHEIKPPEDIPTLRGFNDLDDKGREALIRDLGLAMSLEDLRFCQKYFRDEEKRDPTLTELRVLDTYWSDHCRHTTFSSRLDQVDFEQGELTEPIREAYEGYLKSRDHVYGERTKEKAVCLMDMATLAMKHLRKEGKLDDLEVSEEVNACSIIVPVETENGEEEWLVMFKNETHNHPTEIEPFGGAATCLGGAIRDPLSGRAYVYQAMRVTGAADPRQAVAETLPGKLPQRKICVQAAEGYSSYGNQIGLATGQVTEVYHPRFVAKRMEIGAVIGAAPRENVFRGEPQAGDIILLVGGRTGRDGIGGATGSSKEHTVTALENSAEVQKGDPVMERKLQRLFRIPEAARMIVRCNDFGAGGVSVAIGELAPGLDIDLNKVPRKYEGLDGTELAISESQERMAIVLRPEDEGRFMEFVRQENLEGTHVATVTDSGRLRLKWREQTIVDLSRAFLDTHGAPQTARARVTVPETGASPFEVPRSDEALAERFRTLLTDLNRCSQKGLVERFDASIGAGTVLHPFGGKHQSTPVEAMAAKVSTLGRDTRTATLMSFGYEPDVACWSPFHGAVVAVVEAVARIVASGGSLDRTRLTLQEYFERLREDPERWGKPVAALLGAHWAQMQLEIPAIGGKDSMSGSFGELDVPPTLVAFAVCPTHVDRVISPEFKGAGNRVALVSVPKTSAHLPEWAALKDLYAEVSHGIAEGWILSAHSVRQGGIAEAIAKMAFGNGIGFELSPTFSASDLFSPDYGSLVLELSKDAPDVGRALGTTIEEPVLRMEGEELQIDDLRADWEEALNHVYPLAGEAAREAGSIEIKPQARREREKKSRPASPAKPRVIIPVFPGTNCEWDSKRAFEAAGAEVDVLVFRNLEAHEVEESLVELEKHIRNAQILMMPGGFSAGDEPDGSGKFAAAVLRNPHVREALEDLLYNRDGLCLGICNGFQALIKVGLLPYGEIRDLKEGDPTLTFNSVGRHISRYAATRVVNQDSPWLELCDPEVVYEIPISHGEGRFVAGEEQLEALIKNGQIATQYVDANGKASLDPHANPNGSVHAIEGIVSLDGRIFGKMGHNERVAPSVARNIPGTKVQPIFEGGVRYFS